MTYRRRAPGARLKCHSRTKSGQRGVPAGTQNPEQDANKNVDEPISAVCIFGAGVAQHLACLLVGLAINVHGSGRIGSYISKFVYVHRELVLGISPGSQSRRTRNANVPTCILEAPVIGQHVIFFREVLVTLCHVTLCDVSAQPQNKSCLPTLRILKRLFVRCM